MVDDHVFRKACGKRRDLSMNVITKPGQAGPSTKLFDEVFANFIETKGHGSTCTEQVGTDTGDTVVTRIEEAREDDTFVAGQGYICGRGVGKLGPGHPSHRKGVGAALARLPFLSWCDLL
jgi:hypothetical protein